MVLQHDVQEVTAGSYLGSTYNVYILVARRVFQMVGWIVSFMFLCLESSRLCQFLYSDINPLWRKLRPPTHSTSDPGMLSPPGQDKQGLP